MKNYSIYTYLNTDGQISSANYFGEFSKNNNLIKISYESVEDGNSTLTTLFIFANKQVRLLRKGHVNYTCILNENTNSEFDIDIDSFKIKASIYCRKIKIQETEEYFKLTLKYDVIMGEKTSAEYYIEVKKGAINVN
ncbi:MAG: DUF1934 domain-containing protein [Clostridia bacterium]|nr:DUF1934 domain-containing protein [Clostridia bacterium]